SSTASSYGSKSVVGNVLVDGVATLTICLSPYFVARARDSRLFVSFASNDVALKFKHVYTPGQRNRSFCAHTEQPSKRRWENTLKEKSARPSKPQSVKESRPKEEKEYVVGLEKGLSIIEAFGIINKPMTLSEAAEITGHSRASARRSLLTLQKLGYVELEDRHFRLAPRVLRLGHAYLTSTALARTSQPTLEAISERTKVATSFTGLDGLNVVFVARGATSRILSSGLSLGSRLPAYGAATGRALLADLPIEEVELRLSRMARNKLTPH